MERRIKGYLRKAATVSAFALLVLNIALLLSVQSRQKEMERMLTLALEQGKEALVPKAMHILTNEAFLPYSDDLLW